MTVWRAGLVETRVENRNKHAWKRIVRQVVYLQRLYRDARSTEHKILNNDVWLTWNISISPHHRLLSFMYEVCPVNIKLMKNYRRPTNHFSTGGLSAYLSVCLSVCLSVSRCSWPYIESHVRHYSDKRHGASSHQPLRFPAIRFPVSHSWHIWRRYNLITYSWCFPYRNKFCLHHKDQ